MSNCFQTKVSQTRKMHFYDVRFFLFYLINIIKFRIWKKSIYLQKKIFADYHKCKEITQ